MKQNGLKRVATITFIIITAISTSYSLRYSHPGLQSAGWMNDILGNGYEVRYVALGNDFDGEARCAVIRKKSYQYSSRAILYIHGFNDYFFQKDFGNRFVDSCYSFYAVDLRRYGRSLEPWQYPFNIRDIRTYFQEIDSAINIIHKDGINDITLYGHSTGGLTAALFMAEKGARSAINKLILDSPFLEWNFNVFYRNIAIPAVSILSLFDKDLKIKQKHCDGYSHSLLKRFHGEWDYNTNWKMIYSPPVTAGWVNAITKGQDMLMNHSANITSPVLVLKSDRKITGCSWTPEFMTGDAVLDPEMIGRLGKKLGKYSQVITIDSALHNTILSPLPARENAYKTIFKFLNKH